MQRPNEIEKPTLPVNKTLPTSHNKTYQKFWPKKTSRL
jgi:hypothetical protein